MGEGVGTKGGGRRQRRGWRRKEVEYSPLLNTTGNGHRLWITSLLQYGTSETTDRSIRLKIYD